MTQFLVVIILCNKTVGLIQTDPNNQAHARLIIGIKRKQTKAAALIKLIFVNDSITFLIYVFSRLIFMSQCKKTKLKCLMF